MSHADKADKLLIKPAAGARPAPPRTRRQFIPKARTRRPVTRRVTRGTATPRLATASDRPTRPVLPSPETSLGSDGWEATSFGCLLRVSLVFLPNTARRLRSLRHVDWRSLAPASTMIAPLRHLKHFR